MTMNAQDESEFLAGLPLAALIIGPDERIEAANAPAMTMFGAAAVGRNLALSIRTPDLLAAISDVADGGPAVEVGMRTPDDSQYRITVSPLTGGPRRRVLCVLQDMTSEAQTQMMRRDFVANVSHELRTPLTALMGFIETLRTAAKDDPAARDRFLAIMEREAGRMNRLVRDLLHLSRVEGEERVRPRDPVDVAALIRGVAATVRPLAEDRGSRVVLEGLDGELQLPGDADQLTQVFLNLIENALKYGARDSEVRVSLHDAALDGQQGALRIDVADQGEGIDPVHLPRLTERFYRVDSHRSRAEGGTGLGLAIVKHIIGRHRGRLEIDSVKGEGSVFSVVLPKG